MGNDLMKPRYKVIADYPLRYFEIGEIFYPADEKNYCVVEGGYFSSDLTKYPHLFKKLFWWEERQSGEMPDYIKLNNKVYETDAAISTGKITKDCLPSTLEEYNTYIQSKQQ